MKSLLISSVFPPRTGGSGRWFWEIYRRLPVEDYAIAAGECAGSQAFDAEHDLDLRRIPFEYPDLGLFSVSGYLRYRNTMKEIESSVDMRSLDAIHCGALLPDGWVGRMLAQKYNLPLMQFMHGEEVCYANSSRQLRWMGEKVLKSAKVVVANSRNTATILESEWALPESQIEVLNPGVDCDRFKPVPADERVRERLGWSGKTVLLTVGRLQERKGQDMLIRALPEILERNPNVIYAIVGDGEDYARLQSLVEERQLGEHVKFYRDLNDEQMLECYQQCDLFVLPNRQVGDDIEGFGMVLLEAQACGKPVIAGDSGGTRETMQVGVTGDLVNCDQPESLIEIITNTLRTPEASQARGQVARSWMEETFDWSVLAAQADQIFGKVGFKKELQPVS